MLHQTTRASRAQIPLVSLLSWIALASAASNTAIASAASAGGVEAALRTLPLGSGTLAISDFPLQGGPKAATLEVERMQVWSPGAKVFLGDQELPLPSTLFFKGEVAGTKGSSVVLTLSADGAMGGLVFTRDGAWGIGTAGGPGTSSTTPAMSSTQVDMANADLPVFNCGADALGNASHYQHMDSNPGSFASLQLGENTKTLRRLLAPASGGNVVAQSTTYTVKVAVDTDVE
jgi:hypothetical protein